MFQTFIMIYINITNFVLISQLEKDHSMIQTSHTLFGAFRKYLLQSVTKTFFYHKVWQENVPYCLWSFLKILITKCYKKIFTKCDIYHKVWQELITKCCFLKILITKCDKNVIKKCDIYHKVWQEVITKCYSYCKVGHNTCLSEIIMLSIL